MHLSFLLGSIQWISKSIRPGHKRPHWFVDISVIPDADNPSLEDDYFEVEFFPFGKQGDGGRCPAHQKDMTWEALDNLERGKPVRIYKGPSFKLMEDNSQRKC